MGVLEFQEKRKLKTVLYSKITLVLLAVLIILALNAVKNVYQKQAMARDNLDKTSATLEDLRTREKMLSSELERLETEAGKEEEIREKYGLVKPGEEVLMIEHAPAAIGSQDSSGGGFWSRLGSWFK